MFSLEGKVVAVVGSATGIGKAIAVGMASQGGTVHCLDVDEVRAKQTAGEIRDTGSEAFHAAVDVTSSSSVDEAFDAVIAESGSLDVVVCTPGINIRKPLVEYVDADYDAVVDVNLRGSFHVMRAAGQRMAPRGKGSIIVISSISDRVVEPGQVMYAGTKAAIAQMVRVLGAELGPSGVRVNAIAPGPVETELTEPIRAVAAWGDAYAQKIALKRWAKPREMAGPAVFLASDAASYVNGECLFVDGGWTDLDQRFGEIS